MHCQKEKKMFHEHPAPVAWFWGSPGLQWGPQHCSIHWLPVHASSFSTFGSRCLFTFLPQLTSNLNFPFSILLPALLTHGFSFSTFYHTWLPHLPGLNCSHTILCEIFSLDSSERSWFIPLVTLISVEHSWAPGLCHKLLGSWVGYLRSGRVWLDETRGTSRK